ncbi:HlyD family secretion protein [Marinobacter xestospongiae]|uniref:HlyD family efflux transporter periplasmic adaptor subunit n=1 Tax=Marinobacter xestospongiae TaxID=994319 RepID=A0ABU3VU39_9GAMM|nr:HlyD family efflux transporter periplasmic adaptor subunit [Marinobacter xestospongiae]MDV2077785.1 HlyD family efflux transporter periplasmic adaptor subunit [Marinobacter xestospongiae]
MTDSLFREEAINHQRNRLWGDVILTQPLSTKLVTVAATIVVVLLISFIIFGTYSRKERVQGYLVPESGLIEIYPDQQGTAVDIAVESGDQVDAGDTLLRITTERSLENGSTMSSLLNSVLEQQKTLLENRIARARQRQKKKEAHLTKRIKNINAQIAQLSKQRSLQQERLDLSRQRYASLEALRQEQLMSESDYQDRYQIYLDERQGLERVEQSLLTEKGNLLSAKYELSSLEMDVDEQIDQLEEEINRIEQQTIQYDGDSSFTLTAPIDGTVTSLQVSQGQQVNPRRPLLALLPKGQALQADLFVPTRAIGFLSPGLAVEVRYDAFPYQRFGAYPAKLSQISKTVLSPDDISAPIPLREPVYRARATLIHDDIVAYGDHFPLQAGMLFEAHLHLDERPLYQWLLNPLYSLKGAL